MDVTFNKQQPFFSQSYLQREPFVEDKEFFPDLTLPHSKTNSSLESSPHNTLEFVPPKYIEKLESIIQRKEGENHSTPLKVYSRRMQPALESLHALTIHPDKEALSDENWKKAMLEEMNALKKNNTWELVNLPKGKRKTLRNKVCKLNKALYDLKQSPRAWFGRFAKAMKNIGYCQSQGDHTLFIRHSEKGRIMALIVYVDDIVVTGDDWEEMEKLKKKLANEFKIKDLGRLKYFLGIKVVHSKEGMVISQ
ncbi:hypothetical protein AAG906_020105 [Vitis piasezkii]